MMDFPDSTSAQDGGFLFATFKGEATPLTEQIYFALSENGRDWTALGGGEPVLVSQVGEKGARDPFLVRSADGAKCWLIATDLSINLNRDWKRATTQGSRSILVWESNDLVHWQGPRLVEVAAPDAGCTWAPEAIWDEKRAQFLVFWASTNGRDDFSKQRVWAGWTTDFKTFSEPFVWIEKSDHVLDTNVVRDGDRYFRFSNDGATHSISCEHAGDLLGEWQLVPDFSLIGVRGFEGPFCFRLPDGQWCLLLDFAATGQGYQGFLSHDLAGGQWEAAGDFSFPFLFRHGGLLPLTASEWERLKAAQ